MKLFSHESLRQYLGDDLVGQLLTEWENNGPVTKKRLAEMIVQLNGIDLLKKPKFRQDVLLHLEEKDIEEVCDLLYNMLSWNYKKRYTAEQCLEHPFLKDVIINKNETESINTNCKIKVINN